MPITYQQTRQLETELRQAAPAVGKAESELQAAYQRALAAITGRQHLIPKPNPVPARNR